MRYLYGPVCNDFDAGKSITWAIVRALNILTFLSPEIALSRQASAISGPIKVEMFRALTMAQVVDLPHQDHYVQGRINTMSIGDFMYMGP